MLWRNYYIVIPRYGFLSKLRLIDSEAGRIWQRTGKFWRTSLGPCREERGPHLCGGPCRWVWASQGCCENWRASDKKKDNKKREAEGPSKPNVSSFKTYAWINPVWNDYMVLTGYVFEWRVLVFAHSKTRKFNFCFTSLLLILIGVRWDWGYEGRLILHYSDASFCTVVNKISKKTPTNFNCFRRSCHSKRCGDFW